MRTGDAVMELVSLGYHFELAGEKVGYEYRGPGNPDPEKVAPLLALVRERKEDVRYFLKSYCPKCGGVCFIANLCMACDWQQLTEMYPGLKAPG